MTTLEQLWDRAKTGVKFGVGPVAVNVRASRRARVDANRRGRRRAILDAAPERAFLALGREGATQVNERSTRSSSRGQVALVVGAGPGIGTALARRLSAAGMHASLVVSVFPLCALNW